MFCFGTEIGTENHGFSLVLVPNTEILVPWQPYSRTYSKCCFIYTVIAVYLWLYACHCPAEKKKLLPSQRYLAVFIRFSSRICLYWTAFFYPLPSEACQAFPQHDAATTALHCGDGVFLICSVWLMPNMPLILMAKHLNFGLIRPQNLLPTGFRVSHMLCWDIFL